MRFPAGLLSATLIRRLNRFAVEVDLEGSGVQAQAYRCRVSPRGMGISGPLPVRL